MGINVEDIGLDAISECETTLLWFVGMNWLLSIALVTFVVQLVYVRIIRRGWYRACRRPLISPEVDRPVSVIVAVKNEAKHIRSLIHALRHLVYDHFEVIFVDDHSTDDTVRTIYAEIRDDPRFRLLSMNQNAKSGKKAALSKGIAAAEHELLAFTDADCSPRRGWLKTLNAYHAAFGSGVLVGYSPFLKEAHFLNRLARYENVRTAIHSAAAIGHGKPYMGVGRNLSYPRAIFHKTGGFSHGATLLSGDDDLFIQSVVRQKAAGVRFVCASEAFVPGTGPASWTTWLRQKKRHVSASRAYSARALFHLGMYHGSVVLLWPLALLSGAAYLLLPLFAAAITVFANAAPCRRLDQADLLPWTPLLEPCYQVYLLLAGFFSILPAPAFWRSRTESPSD